MTPTGVFGLQFKPPGPITCRSRSKFVSHCSEMTAAGGRQKERAIAPAANQVGNWVEAGDGRAAEALAMFVGRLDFAQTYPRLDSSRRRRREALGWCKLYRAKAAPD